MRARRQTGSLQARRLWTVTKVLRQAKVGEDAVTSRRDEHVLRLQVAVVGKWRGERVSLVSRGCASEPAYR